MQSLVLVSDVGSSVATEVDRVVRPVGPWTFGDEFLGSLKLGHADDSWGVRATCRIVNRLLLKQWYPPPGDRVLRCRTTCG